MQCTFSLIDGSLEKQKDEVKPEIVTMSAKRCNTVVLRPSGTGFEWCINQYNGCAHGCLYCYGMVMRRMSYKDWIQPKPRKDVVQNLKKDIRCLRENDMLHTVKDIFVGSTTDSYQPLELEHELTRQILETLIENELPFTILTKRDIVLRDIDLLKGYAFCRAGVTLTSLDESYVKTLEPGAVTARKRIDALGVLESEGISTYLSCEPIMPVAESDPIQIVQYLNHLVDLFEFGKWSRYRYKHIPKYFWENYCDEYYYQVFTNLLPHCDQLKVNYCIASHSEKFFRKYGLPFTTQTNQRQ